MKKHRKFLEEYSDNERRLIKNRIISYLESGFSETYALKQINISKDLYRRMFEEDLDIYNKVKDKYHGILRVSEK